ncbi:MAG TPA: amino acid ABC transporter substrate-binding protein [Firmicutes bacterium]|jgi:polar amino acid transport system substrate-binding protein|nr:amino acid ABC transporter substrate-binding protein [Bacillota bacterium]
MGKRFLLLGLALLLVFSMAACTPSEPGGEAGETQGEVSGGSIGEVPTAVEGSFIVGFDQNFPPMGFVGDDGEFTGFDLDLAAEVANRLGLELVLQPIAWDAKDMELSSKNIDCIWNGFTINGREDDYTWTVPYMSNTQVFVVRADSGINSFADLAGKTVVVQADSSAETALVDRPDLVDTFGDYIKAADYLGALMDLESGAVDAVAMDDTVANYQMESREKDFVVLEEALSPEDYGVGFLLGNEALRDIVQATLEEMAADGKMAEISHNWFGKDITTIGK